MDIKMMHEMIEKLTECAKHEVDKGVELVDTKEMGEVTDIIKDLSEAMYYRTLVEAMKEAEYGEDYDYMGAYDEHERKGYRGQPRNSKGQFMSRRGYESRMMPDMDYDEIERMRDYDRESGKMYYGGSGSMGGSQESIRNYNGSNYSSGNQQTSRSENARRGYEESKMMQDGSPESKKKAMESLENYMKELGEDMSELIGKMDSNEKSMLRSKLQMLAQRVQ